MRRRDVARRHGWLLLAALGCGCGSGRGVLEVIVTSDGILAGIDHLEVRVAQGGRSADPIAVPVPAPPDAALDAAGDAALDAAPDAAADGGPPPDVAVPPDLGCPVGTTKCGNACVDTMSDAAHCGGCGVACPMGQGCAMGRCGCINRTMKCGNACVDAKTDPANCGACGNACAMGKQCIAGACIACPPTLLLPGLPLLAVAAGADAVAAGDLDGDGSGD